MAVVAEAFRTGGVWMYLILTAVILGWPLAFLGMLSLFTKNAKLAMAAGALVGLIGLSTVGIGVVGYATGMAEVEEAVEIATPENRERLRAIGEEYASYPLYFGLGGGSVPLLLGLLLFGVGMMKRDPADVVLDDPSS